jgi:hypothetical protein
LGEPKINSFYNSVLFLMKILWSFAFVPLLWIKEINSEGRFFRIF